MFNPGMMGNMMGGQLPQLPTTQELWKDEKSKYRHWMILFGFGLLIVIGLMVAGLVMNLEDRTHIENMIVDSIKKTTANGDIWIVSNTPLTLQEAHEWAHSAFTSSFIVSPSMSIGFVGIGVLLFGASLVESYKVKSFAKLSSWPTFVIGFGAFMGFFSLISFSWNHVDAFISTGAILAFVANISNLVVYFGGGMQVSRIRKQFVMSDRIEKMKSNPQFQAAQQQAANMMGGYMGGMGPYAPQNMAPQGTPAPQAPAQPAAQPTTPAAAAATTATPAQPAKPSERQKLEAMSVTDLKKIAKKLSISGSSDMKKDELIENILRIHEGKK